MAQNKPQLATDRTDQPADETPADHVVRRHEFEQAKVKLLALAGALIDIPGASIRYRVVETPSERMALLRVWDSRKGGPSETVACLRLAEGWRFTAYPYGATIADADGIQKADDAHAAARVIAAHVEQLMQTPPVSTADLHRALPDRSRP